MYYVGIFALSMATGLVLLEIADWLSRPAERDEHEDGV